MTEDKKMRLINLVNAPLGFILGFVPLVFVGILIHMVDFPHFSWFAKAGFVAPFIIVSFFILIGAGPCVVTKVMERILKIPPYGIDWWSYGKGSEWKRNICKDNYYHKTGQFDKCHPYNVVIQQVRGDLKKEGLLK